MSFSSLQFIFVFLPVFLVLYYLIPEKYKKIVLLVGSSIFYSYGSLVAFIIYAISMFVNFGFNKMMLRIDPKMPGSAIRHRRRVWLTASVIWNVAILLGFKYLHIIIPIVGNWLGLEWNMNGNYSLPLGISFYTFQVLAYQIDCRRGGITKPATFLDFAVYMTMFPQLISGPILRFSSVKEQLAKLELSLEQLESGAKMFALGLGIKVLLANQVATLWNSIQVSGAESISPIIAWLGAFAYSMQLYFDFWGYSVMAIGLGRMIGFDIVKNFDHPYSSVTVSEFWRRWHITLGTWFRDYIYIPMGGSKCAKNKMIWNLLVVWFLTGIWHGASRNFLLWGMVLFCLIVLEKLFLGRLFTRVRFLGHIYVLVVIPVTWVIFAIPDFHVLMQYLKCMVGISSNAIALITPQLLRYLTQYWWLLLIGCLFITPLPLYFYEKKEKSWYMNLILLVIFWLSVYEIQQGNNNPFLYFGF